MSWNKLRCFKRVSFYHYFSLFLSKERFTFPWICNEFHQLNPSANFHSYLTKCTLKGSKSLPRSLRLRLLGLHNPISSLGTSPSSSPSSSEKSSETSDPGTLPLHATPPSLLWDVPRPPFCSEALKVELFFFFRRPNENPEVDLEPSRTGTLGDEDEVWLERVGKGSVPVSAEDWLGSLYSDPREFWKLNGRLG